MRQGLIAGANDTVAKTHEVVVVRVGELVGFAKEEDVFQSDR